MAGNIKGITVEIGGDTTKLSKALNAVNNETKSLQSELKGIDTLLKFDPSNTELLSQKQKVLAESIENTKSKLQTLKEVEEQVQKQFENGDIGEEEFRSFQREIEATEQKIEKLETQMREFGSVSAQQIAAAGEKLKDYGGKVESAGKAMMPVTAAITAVGAAAASMSMDFENAIAKVATIADTSEVPIDDLQSAILELSNQTGISASEIADNVYNAISAGQKTGDAVNFVSNSTKLAKAGFAEAGDALDILTTIMNAYGLEADEVGDISDKLITTQNLGKTTVAELSQTMGKVIPTANAYSVNIDQLCTSYSLMTKNGIATAQSTTYINSMLNELGKSGSNASDILKEKTGSSFTELMNSGYSLADCLAIINESAQEQGLSFGDMWSNANSAKAAMTLLKDGTGEFNDTLTQMQGSTGATDSAFEKLGTNSTVLKKALNELKNTGIELGDAIMSVLGPMIQKFADTVKMFSNWFSGLSDGQKEMIVVIGGVVAAIGPLLVIVGKLMTSIGSIMTMAPKISSAIASISAPVLAVAAIIGVLVAAFATLWSTNEEFRNKITEIWNGIKETLSGFFQGIVDRLNELGFSFESITDVIKAVWSAFCNFLAPIFEGAFSVISSVLNTICDVILGILDVFIGIFTGNWEQAWTGITEIFSGIWNGITGVFSAVWDTITGIFEVFLGWFGTSWEEVWTSISTFFSDIWNGIVTFFSDTWENIKTTASSAAENVESGVSSAWETVKSKTSSAWDTIKDNISSKWEEIKNTTSDAGEKLKIGISTAWDYIKDSIIGMAMEGIKNIFQTQWNAAQNIIETIINAIKTIIENIWNVIKTLLSGDMEQIKNTISSSWENIKSAISGALSSISSTISDAFKSMWSTISGTMNNIRDNIINTLSSLPSKMQEIGSNIVSGIWNGISSGWQWLKDRVAGLAESLLNSAKAALDINSPSKKFADEVGKWIPAGIGEGITTNAKSMLDPLNDLLDGAVDGATIEKNITASYNAEVTAADNRRYDSFIRKLDELIAKTGNDIYLDGKTLIGGTKNRIDEVLANKTMLKARGM